VLTKPDVFIHPTALVETADIGPGTRVWAYAHVQAGARIGPNCNVGDHCFIETGVTIGANVTIKNNVCVWQGITIEDGAFIGPNVAFTNDRFPRSPRLPDAQARYGTTAGWLERTIVGHGCSIGANATILPNVRLGRFAMVGAGSVVTSDLPPHALVIGSPARVVGQVCRCGRRLTVRGGNNLPGVCSECGFELRVTPLK